MGGGRWESLADDRPGVTSLTTSALIPHPTLLLRKAHFRDELLPRYGDLPNNWNTYIIFKKSNITIFLITFLLLLCANHISNEFFMKTKISNHCNFVFKPDEDKREIRPLYEMNCDLLI